MRQQAKAEAESQATAHVESQCIIMEYESNSTLPPPQDANLNLQSLINTVSKLKEQFQQHTNRPPYRKPYNNCSGGWVSRGGSEYLGNIQNQQISRRNQSYLWLHGTCNHSGANCRNKADGHKPTGTFQNMMNGGTKNFFWVPQPPTWLTRTTLVSKSKLGSLTYAHAVISYLPIPSKYQAIADTCSTSHYIAPAHGHLCKDVIPTSNDPVLRLSRM